MCKVCANFSPTLIFSLCASHPPMLNEVSSVVFEDEGRKKVVFDNLFRRGFSFNGNVVLHTSNVCHLFSMDRL
jgi:hypothetical protein